MNEDGHSTDPELAAMHQVLDALGPLDQDAQKRVAMYVNQRLGLSKDESNRVPRSTDNGDEHSKEPPDPTGHSTEYSTLAELYDAAQPVNDPNRALIAGYWLQVCQGAESFVGLSINKDLKDLGHGLSNVTNALTALKTETTGAGVAVEKER